MTEFTEREFQILRFVARSGGCTAYDVKEECGISYTNATSLLLEYFNRGWLSKERDSKKYRYWITDQGKSRLKWLSENRF